MTQNKPLLSICIPTYNRDYLVKDLLEEILPIVEKYKDVVEVLLSDNCSPDNTENICRDFSTKYDFFIYKKQTENIGPDRNFQFLLQNSNGLYSWLLGDGCSFDENLLVSLLSEIKNHNYDLISLGDKERNKNDHYKVYTDHNELLKELGWHLTWISALVFSRRIIEKFEYDRFYNSSFLQTGIIFEYFAVNPVNVCFNPDIHVISKNVPKKGHWLPKIIDTFCRQWTEFVLSLPVSYSFENKLACIISHDERTGLFRPGKLIEYRVNGYYNLKKYKKNYFYIKCSVKAKFFMLILCFIPVFLLKIIKR